VNDVGTILVGSLPAFLPLGGAILALRRKDWGWGPRLLVAGSLLAMAITWVLMVAYWWLNFCWDTDQPCDGSVESRLGVYLLLGSLAGLIVGLLWAGAQRRADPRSNAPG
jgi:hypothetical protein